MPYMEPVYNILEKNHGKSDLFRFLWLGGVHHAWQKWNL